VGRGGQKMQRVSGEKKGLGNKFIAWLHYIASNKVIYPKRPHSPTKYSYPYNENRDENKKKKKVYLKLQIP
jgi:hypothetical protein